MSNIEVWVFHGANGRFTSGVFATREKGEDWIRGHKLTGLLTKYPMDVGVYDWAIKSKKFRPKKTDHYKGEFIQKFSSASQEHYHFFEGNLDFGEQN